jgi:cell division protein FtsW
MSMAKNPLGDKKKKRVGLFNIRVGEIDLIFLMLVLALLVIGLLALFSASYAYAYYNYGDSYAFIKPQVGFVAAGIVAMLLLSTVNYRLLYGFAKLIMAVTLGLLVVVLFFPHDGARRWIDLGFTTLQPSEIAKFAVVVLFAHLCVKNSDKLKTFRHGVLPFVIVLAMIVGLMLLQPHLSGIILIITLGALMMLVGGVDLRWFLLAGILAAVGIAVIIASGAIGYADARIQNWLHPENDPRVGGYQILQSLYAIGSGGMMGVGVGASRQKYLYLPEPQNDFIFSVVCEEVGFVGATLIIILFALLVWRGFVIAMRCKDRFGGLLAIGFTSQVGLQTILNIMVVTNTVPNTGISLPFFSYGGTALLMLLGQMGLVLSVSRQSTMEKK